VIRSLLLLAREIICNNKNQDFDLLLTAKVSQYLQKLETFVLLHKDETNPPVDDWLQFSR